MRSTSPFALALLGIGACAPQAVLPPEAAPAATPCVTALPAAPTPIPLPTVSIPPSVGAEANAGQSGGASLSGDVTPGSSSARAIPAERRHGNLVIHDPPKPRTQPTRGYVRTDTEGTFLAHEPRVWVGPPVPAFVPAGIDDLELSRLLVTPEGYFALYRNLFSGGTGKGCAAKDSDDNCTYRGRLYRQDGALAQEIDFNARMAQAKHLRVDELTIDDGVLYYPESCQSYAKDAGGRCSSVVALDLRRTPAEERWRSAHLLSNTAIVPVGDYLVTGYGFTAERDFLYVLDKRTGKVALRVPLSRAPEVYVVKGNVLEVYVYNEEAPMRFEMSGFSASGAGSGKKAGPGLARLP